MEAWKSGKRDMHNVTLQYSKFKCGIRWLEIKNVH